MDADARSSEARLADRDSESVRRPLVSVVTIHNAGSFLREAIDSVLEQSIAEYMRRLEISPGFLPLLIAQTWVDRAGEKNERQKTLGAPMAHPRQDNRFAQYVEILARGTEDPFGVAHSPR